MNGSHTVTGSEGKWTVISEEFVPSPEERLAALIEEHLAKMSPEEAERRVHDALAALVRKK